MLNYIGKYNDAQAIQSALDAGTLANPYVAMTTAGTLDYNSLQPTPPAPSTMGVWSDDGQGTYTFQITDFGSGWEQPVNIGTILGVDFHGPVAEMDVNLAYNSVYDLWSITLVAEGESDTPEQAFEDGQEYRWDTSGVMTNINDSDSALQVDWNGSDTFVFNSGSYQNTLSMTTINPPYPEVSGE